MATTMNVLDADSTKKHQYEAISHLCACTEDGSNRLKCLICCWTFSNVQSFLDHLGTEHIVHSQNAQGQSVYKCGKWFCNKIYFHRSTILVHLKCHMMDDATHNDKKLIVSIHAHMKKKPPTNLSPSTQLLGENDEQVWQTLDFPYSKLPKIINEASLANQILIHSDEKTCTIAGGIGKCRTCSS